MKFSDWLIIAVLAVTLLFCSFSGLNAVRKKKTDVSEWRQALPPTDSLRSGDVIFRNGRGVVSYIFKKFSIEDQEYSHCGIIHIENGKAFVYHIVQSGSGLNDFRKEPIDSFCIPQLNYGFAIYRFYKNENEIDSIAKKYFESKIKFDNSFDLSDDNKLYCTEFVWKTILKAKATDALSVSEVSGKKYISCENIYRNSHAKRIYQYIYSK